MLGVRHDVSQEGAKPVRSDLPWGPPHALVIPRFLYRTHTLRHCFHLKPLMPIDFTCQLFPFLGCLTRFLFHGGKGAGNN
eukprot:m.93887 g.93887  ORF g.93887 m.93887 type:complete len:80 (+) comp13414_c0_seq10:1527-1766(+)